MSQNCPTPKTDTHASGRIFGQIRSDTDGGVSYRGRLLENEVKSSKQAVGKVLLTVCHEEDASCHAMMTFRLPPYQFGSAGERLQHNLKMQCCKVEQCCIGDETCSMAGHVSRNCWDRVAGFTGFAKPSSSPTSSSSSILCQLCVSFP